MASQYGWALNYICENIYFDDLYYLMQEIKKRKLDEYKMSLAIVQNPHLDPKDQKKLWDELNKFDGPRNNSFDPEGFEKLISVMKQGRGVEIKT